MNILMKHKRLIALSEVNYSVEDTVEAVLISNIDGSGGLQNVLSQKL